jgi:hypothetical protein
MLDGGLKEAVEVEDHVKLEREGAQDSPGKAENVEGEENTGKVTKERIERLKRAFRPGRLRDIIDNPGREKSRKETIK